MSQWIKVNRQQVNRPQEQQVDGVTIRMLVSPFDVPEAVRGDFDRERNSFTIEFKYPAGGEGLLERRFDDDTLLRVGKTSGRIYRIEIDLNRIKVKGIDLELAVPMGSDAIIREADEAMSGLSDRLKTPWRSGNYRVAKEVIRDHESELFAALH